MAVETDLKAWEFQQQSESLYLYQVEPGDIVIHFLSLELILSNQQVHMIDNHSNQKDEGYDGRGVGRS